MSSASIYTHLAPRPLHNQNEANEATSQASLGISCCCMNVNMAGRDSGVSRRHDHCCVPQCTSDSRYTAQLSFHSFPKDPTTRKQWIHQIRRDPGKNFQVSWGWELLFTFASVSTVTVKMWHRTGTFTFVYNLCTHLHECSCHINDIWASVSMYIYGI